MAEWAGGEQELHFRAATSLVNLATAPQHEHHMTGGTTMSDKDTKTDKKDKPDEQSRKAKAEDLPAGAKGKNVKGGGSKTGGGTDG
jgi:hypothetical protein